jgi:hypothetical protein
MDSFCYKLRQVQRTGRQTHRQTDRQLVINVQSISYIRIVLATKRETQTAKQNKKLIFHMQIIFLRTT